MNIEPGVVILVIILAAVVYFGIKNKAKVQDVVADFKDDGKLNNSNAAASSPHELVSAVLQHLPAILEAAKPAPAAFAFAPPPAAAVAATGASLEALRAAVVDQATYDVWRAAFVAQNPMLDIYTPKVWTPAPAPMAALPIVDWPTSIPRGSSRFVVNVEPGVEYRSLLPDGGRVAVTVTQGRGSRPLMWKDGTPKPGPLDGADDAAGYSAQPGDVVVFTTDKESQVNIDPM
jgi:hypothetical protein